jgi:hypothetical protein
VTEDGNFNWYVYLFWLLVAVWWNFFCLSSVILLCHTVIYILHELVGRLVCRCLKGAMAITLMGIVWLRSHHEMRRNKKSVLWKILWYAAGYLWCHGGDTILLGQLFGMVLSSRIVEALKVYNMFNGSFS